MNNFDFISYTDEEGQRHFYHSAGTEIFKDGSYHCPDCGPGWISPHHRKALEWYIEHAGEKDFRIPTL